MSIPAGGYWLDDYASERWEAPCKVVSKDYATGNTYRVNTSCGVFENRNAAARDKSNAPEMQMDLKIDCIYRLRVAGARVFGARANILEFDPITCK